MVTLALVGEGGWVESMAAGDWDGRMANIRVDGKGMEMQLRAVRGIDRGL